MPISGIAVVIDADFRAKQRCALCQEPLGEKPFVVLFPLVANPAVSFQHVDCRVAMEQLMDETRL